MIDSATSSLTPDEAAAQPPLEVVTPDEACDLIRVSRATLGRITFPRGSLPCVRFRSGVVTKPRKQYGNKPGPPRMIVRYRRVDLERWIDQNLTGANGAAHNGQ